MSPLAPLLLLPVLAGPSYRSVDELMRDEMRRHAVPGMAYAIMEDGKVVHTGLFGFADLENQVPVRRNTRFEIGSMTKQFTVAAIMLLRQDGKVDLDAPLSTYLKDLPEGWRTLTLRQCVSHTAGLKDYLASYSVLRTDPVREEEIVRKMGTMPLDFAPGTAWQYSNTGLLLAGMVAERVSGEKLEDLWQKRLFGPLGMTSTSTSQPERVLPNRARPYAFDGKGYTNRPVINPTLAGAAGNLVSTLDDLARWSRELQHPQVLSAESVRLMTTPTLLENGGSSGYGLGFFVQSDRGRPIVEHGGNTAGMSSEIFTVPGKRLAVVVLTNVYGYGPSQSARRALSLLDPSWDLLARREQDPHPRRSLELMAAARRWGRGKYDQDLFSAEYRAKLSTLRGQGDRGLLVALGKNAKTFRYLDGEPAERGGFRARYAFRIGSVELPVEVLWYADRVAAITPVHTAVQTAEQTRR